MKNKQIRKMIFTEMLENGSKPNEVRKIWKMAYLMEEKELTPKNARVKIGLKSNNGTYSRKLHASYVLRKYLYSELNVVQHENTSNLC
jgi:hypothetical protein